MKLNISDFSLCGLNVVGLGEQKKGGMTNNKQIKCASFIKKFYRRGCYQPPVIKYSFRAMNTAG